MTNLKFYTYPSCTSCRRTKKWLKSHGVPFQEKHLFRETPSHDELMKILTLTTDGIDEILATRSKSFRDLNLDVNELKISDFIKLVQENPKLLRRPLLLAGDQLIVGYNEEGLRSIANLKQTFHIKTKIS